MWAGCRRGCSAVGERGAATGTLRRLLADRNLRNTKLNEAAELAVACADANALRAQEGADPVYRQGGAHGA
jgi:hypothetical protein